MRVTTNYVRSGQRLLRTVVSLLVFFAAVESSKALDDLFKLSQTTGTAYDMTGATQVYGRSSAVASNLINIGFTFRFDGRNYTTFSVNTSGAMSLGTVTQRYYYPYYYPNYTVSTSSYNLGDKYPFFAVYWMYVGYPLSNGGVYYKVVGSAPNRVLVVEWRNVFMQGSSSSSAYSGGTFQARFYEGSNKIEYFYGQMTNGTSYYASIGMVSSSTRWLNIWGNNINQYYTYPNGGYYFYRYPSSYPMSNNRLFIFNPCEDTVAFTGDLSQGGTTSMNSGDVLMDGITVQRGSGMSFQPFSISNPANGCNDLTYSATFSGIAAGDYSMASGTIVRGGTMSPQIRFTPLGVGERTATMTLALSNGKKFTFGLGAEGSPRINWIGDVPEGGIAAMGSGNTLLVNVEVERNDSRDVTPFTIENFNLDPTQSGASVEYVLDDPLDEYLLSLPGGTVEGGTTQQTGRTTLGPGQISRPVITFSPHKGGSNYGSGVQEATLTVTADGETRVFTLSGFAVAPVLEMTLGGIDVAKSDRNFYRNEILCVGEQATTLAFTMTNTNRRDVVIHGLDIFEVDSRVQQGAPKYPQRVDQFGEPISSHDYRLSQASGVAPQRVNRPVAFPATIAPGATETFYLTFVAQRPGKRYARAFLSTNAVNFYGEDLGFFVGDRQGGSYVEGLMTLELYGQGEGSRLSSSPKGELNGLSLVFDPVKVGRSGETETMLYNTGSCDLRIDADQARLSSGDVGDFELVEVFGGATRVGQDWVIPAGGTATIRARFTPNRSGSRRATMMLATNDSTLGGSISAANGVYYLNLYGVGQAELQASALTLPPAVIKGPSSSGVVRLANTSSEVLTVTGATLGGVDMAEIVPDPSRPWPALPVQMLPGAELEFGIRLNPEADGEPGIRRAEITFTYGPGEAVTGSIEGLVGTRLLRGTPGTLFDGMEVPVGTVMRRLVVLSNTGTLPVRLDDIRIEGPGMVNYQVGESGRRVIDAGGFEFIEVTYAPRSSGSASAALVVVSNSVDGPISIELNGLSPGTAPVGSGSGNGTRIFEPIEGAGRSAASLISLDLGLIPSPVRERATIEMTFTAEGDARLLLYGVDGREQGVLFSGTVMPGTRTMQFDGSALPAGVYLIRLEQGGRIVSRTLTVVK